jgi:hypothetical protein
MLITALQRGNTTAVLNGRQGQRNRSDRTKENRHGHPISWQEALAPGTKAAATEAAASQGEHTAAAATSATAAAAAGFEDEAADAK